MSHKIYLIGAGPGDPELITRRGEALLRRADCVIYDRLVNPKLLKLIPPACRRIYAGKHSDEGGAGQARINRLLVQKALAHRLVVRLKGGDPSVFGRLAEEVQALSDAGISYEVVPGVSSAWAAAAAAGIPLTDRRFSSSVAFVTGHGAQGKKSTVRWEALARGVDTLVILMGWSSLPQITRRLVAAGRLASTPMALVRWASTPQQKIWVTTLGHWQSELRKQPDFGSPVVVILGEVVRHRATASLKGRRILITRPKNDSVEMSRRFETRGARCVHLPTIRIRPRTLKRTEKQKLSAQLRAADWVVFNSHHAVEAVRPWLKSIRGKIGAIGPRTASALREAGRKVDLVPAESSGMGVARAFGKLSVRNQTVVIPRSRLGIGDEPTKTLRCRGARVVEIPVYDTAEVLVPAATLRRTLKNLDAVTFTSASTARAFLGSLKKARLPLKKVLNGTPVVAIGPSTAAVLRAGGVRRATLPGGKQWNLEGLVEAVEEAVNG